jgi:hypothetical protein
VFNKHAQPESTTDSIPSVEDPVIPTDAQPEVMKASPTPERKAEVKRAGSMSKCDPFSLCFDDSTQGAPAVPYGFPKSAVPCSKRPLPTSVVRMTREVLNTPLHLVSDRQEPAVSSSKPEVVTGMFTHAPSVKASPSRHATHEMTPIVIHEARDVRAQSPSIKTRSTQLIPAETVPLASLSHTEAGPGPIPSASAWKLSMSDCVPTLSTRAIPKQPIDALGIRLQEPLLSTSKEMRSLARSSLGFPLHV